MPESTPTSAPVFLQVAGLRKRLGRQRVLRDLSFTVDKGERVRVAGANGAGKSTLFRVLAGVLRADRGRVHLEGHELLPGSAERRRIGYVPERADPPEHLSVEELLAFVAAVKGCEALASDVAYALGLHRLFAKRIGELSLGQRRRACLGAALTGEPSLLLLDEPSNGLDLASIDGLREILKASTATIVFASHDDAFAGSLASRELSLHSDDESSKAGSASA